MLFRSRVDGCEKIEAELASEKEKHREARDEIETLSSALEEIKIDSEDALNQWTGTYCYLFSGLLFNILYQHIIILFA